MNSYSVIIPCYKATNSLNKTIDLIVETFEKLKISKYEVILIIDSPNDLDTVNRVKDLYNKYNFITYVNLIKNVGQHNAVMAGLNYAKNEFIITMDDDMQTNPNQIPKLINKINEGYDVVYGYYNDKKHSLIRNIYSYVNYLSGRYFINKPKNLHTSSFNIMRSYIRDNMIKFKHPYTYLPGLVLKITSNIGNVELQHFKREEGESSYTFKKLFNLWKNMLFFSINPIQLITKFGLLCFFVGLILIFFKNLFVLSLFLIFSGIILVAIGFIGAYIGRIMQAVNGNYQFNVKEVGERKNL